MRKGYIYITRSGYDPQKGKHVKDPYLGDVPTLGACRPDLRKNVNPGDVLFIVSGKVKNQPQYLMGAFEVAEKIPATDAYRRFPDLRLHKNGDGQMDGNIIVNSRGDQHTLDDHNSFERRKENYIVGRNPVVLTTPEEIARGREKTMDILRFLFGKDGEKPRDVIGRMSKLDNEQVTMLFAWLRSLKAPERELVRKAIAANGSAPAVDRIYQPVSQQHQPR